MNSPVKSAIVFGATGLVGNLLLNALLNNNNYNKVVIYVRETLCLTHEKLVQHVVNFDTLAEIEPVDHVFICLGTTIKKAKTKAAFSQVDYRYPTQVAALAAQNRASYLGVVSAVGANKNALSFYSKTKGLMEEKITTHKHHIQHICMARPSLISGNRAEKRPLEDFFNFLCARLSWLFIGPLKQYQPVPAKKIAQSLIQAAQQNYKGVQIIESAEIQNS